MRGKLYLVATPIGNLEDITFRAIKTLKEVDIIAAEDTRHTLKLLNHYDIKKPLESYYKEKEKIKSDYLIEKLLNGKNIALVSDAGTPAISDPGEVLVKQAIQNNIEIVPIPGACALINALISSGMDTKEFLFVGFLSANKNEKKQKLEDLKYSNNTMIFYEAPHKLTNTLNIMLEIFGNRFVVLARELTKIHEEFIRGNLEEVLQKCDEPKGEFVILVEGNNGQEEKINYMNLSLDEHYKLYEKQGFDKKEIIKKIAKDRQVTKNEIYKNFLKKEPK